MNQPYTGDAAVTLLKDILSKTQTAFPLVRRQALIYQGAPPRSTWQVGCALVSSVAKAGTAVEMNYGKFIYEESFLAVDEAIAWLSGLVNKGEWKVAGNATEVGSPVHFTYTYETRKSYVPYSPCHWMRTRLATDGGSYNHEPLVVPDEDVYPHVNALLHDKFGIPDLNGNTGNVNIYLPPYHARIGAVVIKGRTITVRVPGAVPAEEFSLRVWARDAAQHMNALAPVDRDPVTMRLKRAPQFLAVFLVDKVGTLIDRWESEVLPQSASGILTPKAWFKLIASGESDTLEFKNYSNPLKNIHHSQAREINVKEVASQLVAFANTAGGTLFIGVHDDTTIQGVDDARLTKTKITEAAHSSCDPKLTPKLFTLTDGKHTIVGATVEKGKGLYLANGTPYVRRNATTRKATSAEATQIAKGTTPQIPNLQRPYGGSAFGY